VNCQGEKKGAPRPHSKRKTDEVETSGFVLIAVEGKVQPHCEKKKKKENQKSWFAEGGKKTQKRGPREKIGHHSRGRTLSFRLRGEEATKKSSEGKKGENLSKKKITKRRRGSL